MLVVVICSFLLSPGQVVPPEDPPTLIEVQVDPLDHQMEQVDAALELLEGWELDDADKRDPDGEQ